MHWNKEKLTFVLNSRTLAPMKIYRQRVLTFPEFHTVRRSREHMQSSLYREGFCLRT